MNDRIYNLSLLADQYAHSICDRDEHADWYQTRDQKFAELIVRECMEVCADRGTHHDGLYSAWASDCSERIGKRFGVEE